MTDAQAGLSLILTCYHEEASFLFLSLFFTFDYPDGQEARRPAPRITALSALAIPSLETFDAGTCARAAD